ncbi:MAG: ferrochelatase [Bacteroidetes bacterium]|nr:ferrochelatase [Bacteroidota bacterium]
MSANESIPIPSLEIRSFGSRSFSSHPVHVGRGDKVGVVLLVPGAPETEDEVFGYLQRHFTLPHAPQSGLKFWISSLRSKLKARLATPQVLTEYQAMGGGSSINRFSREQAIDLRRRLKASVVIPDGVKVDTYLASPFGSPSMVEAMTKMLKDGITHVVLLPLFPQFAMDTTGRALAYWEKMVAHSKIATLPTVAIWEFAIRDSFIEAMNERINQALQRFPRVTRSEVAILFTANGQGLNPKDDKGDPYCCLVHHSVDRVMALQGAGRAYFQSFVQQRSWRNVVGSNEKKVIDALVASGHRAVVVVPVDHVSEQFDSAYFLDVDLRKLAESKGIHHYHVAYGLNCHPLFMEGLTDLVIESIVPSSQTVEADTCLSSCPRPLKDSNVGGNSRSCSLCPYAGTRVDDSVERLSRRHIHPAPAGVRSATSSR